MKSKLSKIIPIILAFLMLLGGCDSTPSASQEESAKELLNKSNEYYALHGAQSSTLNMSLVGSIYGTNINTLMTQTVNAVSYFEGQENYSKLVESHTERSYNGKQSENDSIDSAEGYANGFLFTYRKKTNSDKAPVKLKYDLSPAEYFDYCNMLDKDEPHIDLLECGILPTVNKTLFGWEVTYNSITQEATSALEQWAMITVIDGVPTSITLENFAVVYTINKKTSAVSNTKASLTFKATGNSDVSLTLKIEVDADTWLPENVEQSLLPDDIDNYKLGDAPQAMTTVLDGVEDYQHADYLKFKSDIIITAKYNSQTISKYIEQNVVEFERVNGTLIYSVLSYVTNTSYGGLTNNTTTYDVETVYDGQKKSITLNGTPYSAENQNQWAAIMYMYDMLDPIGVSSSDVIDVKYAPVDNGEYFVVLEYDATDELTQMFESMGLSSPKIIDSLGVVCFDLDKDLNILNIQYEIEGTTVEGYNISCVTNLSLFATERLPSSDDNNNGGNNNGGNNNNNGINNDSGIIM